MHVLKALYVQKLMHSTQALAVTIHLEVEFSRQQQITWKELKHHQILISSIVLSATPIFSLAYRAQCR